MGKTWKDKPLNVKKNKNLDVEGYYDKRRRLRRKLKEPTEAEMLNLGRYGGDEWVLDEKD